MNEAPPADLDTFLATAPPLPPEATIVGGAIRCDTCGAVADTIHLVPWATELTSPNDWTLDDTSGVFAACPDHDPGGYWFPISTLIARPLQWLAHLGGKRNGDAAIERLLWWLGYEGTRLLDRSRLVSNTDTETKEER